MRTNSELRQAVQHHITNKEINLDTVRAEFGEDSEEYSFALRYVEHNSKTLGEKFDIIFPDGNGNGDDVSLESANAGYVSKTKTVTVESPAGFEDMYTSYEIEVISLDDYFAMVMDELPAIIAEYPSVEAFAEAEFSKPHNPELGDYYPEGTKADMVRWLNASLK